MISKAFRLLIILTMFMGAFAYAPAVMAESPACDTRVNNTHAKLLECVTLEGVRAHQAALQAIADANGDTRAANTPGYDASVAYVKETLEAAGYEVQLDPFDFAVFSPAILQQTAPVTATYVTGAFTGSGYGNVSGPVIPVDLSIANPAASTSGCEAADFAGLDFSGSNDIALIQRGSCFFAVKAVNAQAAGAEAVVIMNIGTPGNTGPFVGNASALPDGSPSNLTIPVVGASFADGVALSQPGSTAIVTLEPPEIVTQYNVLAELPGRNNNNVVMAGAHLDSVPAGPGINDNGSGSAAILEVALQMAKVEPRNTVRFAWWGGEESGLVGSRAYVAGLSQEELDRITLYLNFDMVGSPNYVFFIYDGDNSDGVGSGPGPAGSAEIEKTFEAFYTMVGEPFKGTDFTGRSDYGPFIAAGVDIPSGGLFTGAEGIKTPAEAALWGGIAGQQYDPCYHQACDTFDNNNDHALDVNSDAIAFAILQYAMSTEDINGDQGKGNFPPVSGGTPEPGSAADSGLHDHDHELPAE